MIGFERLKRAAKERLSPRPLRASQPGHNDPNAADIPPVHYRPDLDGLRAFAVWATIWFHLFPSQLPGGFIGVDVFFVISGYLITGVILSDHERGTFSLRAFYARRIRRILPALCVVLAAVLAFGWIVLLANEYSSLGKDVVAAGIFASNIRLISETNYFNPISSRMPLLHLWSLGIEEQFYILWPLIIAVCWRSRARLIAATISLTLASLLYNLWCTPSDGILAFYSPFTRAWQLMVGSLVALLHRPLATYPTEDPPPLLSVSGVSFLLGCALLLTGCLLIHPYEPFPGWRALIPTLGAACIVAVRSPSRLHTWLLSNRLMVGIGLISYPLYLWHWPLFSYATILSSGEPSRKITYIIVVATILLACATFYLIERPIRRNRPSGWKSIATIITIAALAFCGGVVSLFDGFPNREAALPISPIQFQATFKGSCATLTKKPDYDDDWCNPRIPDTKPSIFLLGDSLSAPYSAMLLELTKAHPFSFRHFARGQCTSLIGYGPPPCRELLDRVLEQDLLKDIETIIIALDWRAYVYGKHYIIPNATDDSAEAFATALRTTLDYWGSLGKRVVLFYSPPQGMNIDACVPRRLSLRDPGSCRYTRHQAQERDLNYRAKLREIVGQRSNITYFDPFPYLCNETECMVTSGKEYMYLDSISSQTEAPFYWNHMSDYGARYVAHAAHDELTRILSSKR